MGRYVPLRYPDEDEREISKKKIDHLAKYTFSPQSELLFQGQNAHTFGSLTADSDDSRTRFWVHINQLVELVSKMVSDRR